MSICTAAATVKQPCGSCSCHGQQPWPCMQAELSGPHAPEQCRSCAPANAVCQHACSLPRTRAAACGLQPPDLDVEVGRRSISPQQYTASFGDGRSDGGVGLWEGQQARRALAQHMHLASFKRGVHAQALAITPAGQTKSPCGTKIHTPGQQTTHLGGGVGGVWVSGFRVAQV